jgi:hypothetical protein
LASSCSGARARSRASAISSSSPSKSSSSSSSSSTSSRQVSILAITVVHNHGHVNRCTTNCSAVQCKRQNVLLVYAVCCDAVCCNKLRSTTLQNSQVVYCHEQTMQHCVVQQSSSARATFSNDAHCNGTVSTTSCATLLVRLSLQQAVQHCFIDHHRRFKNTAALVPQ